MTRSAPELPPGSQGRASGGAPARANFQFTNRGILTGLSQSLLLFTLARGLGFVGGRFSLTILLAVLGLAAGLVVALGREDVGDERLGWRCVDALVVTLGVAGALCLYNALRPFIGPGVLGVALGADLACALLGAAGLRFVRLILGFSSLSGVALRWAATLVSVENPQLRFVCRVAAQTVVSALLVVCSLVLLLLSALSSCGG